MPTTDEENEVLFHNPAALKEKSDSADIPPQKPLPPSRKVVRASAGMSGDVIRHQPTRSRAGIPAARKTQSTPPKAKSSGATEPPAKALARETEAARAEFAAAAARARAAAAQHQATQVNQAPPTPAEPPVPAPAPAQRSKIPSRRPAEVSPLSQAPTQPTPAAPEPPVQQTAPEPVQNVPAQRVEIQHELKPEPEPEPITAEPPVPEERVRRESGKNFLLHTHGLKKVYDGRTVVNGVEVTVRPSEIVGLLGPNGAGKTTSFYMIVGLVQPNGGSVTFDGKDATHEPMYRRARLGMGYLPQEESIFRKLTVEDNILAVMETQDVPRSERRDRANELMKRFGIQKLARNEAITLSGGEKRRLTIARSLVTNPKLLMLDEPFSGVDPIAVGEIQEIVRSLREQGLAILITDHNVRETLGIVDRAYLMFEGQVKREGSREFLINDPLSRKLYLGEQFSM